MYRDYAGDGDRLKAYLKRNYDQDDGRQVRKVRGARKVTDRQTDRQREKIYSALVRRAGV